MSITIKITSKRKSAIFPNAESKSKCNITTNI